MAANRVRALRGISIALVVFVMLTFSAELKKASAASDRKQLIVEEVAKGEPPVGVDTFLDMIGLDRSSLATNRLRSASRTPQPAGS